MDGSHSASHRLRRNSRSLLWCSFLSSSAFSQRSREALADDPHAEDRHSDIRNGLSLQVDDPAGDDDIVRDQFEESSPSRLHGGRWPHRTQTLWRGPQR